MTQTSHPISQQRIAIADRQVNIEKKLKHIFFICWAGSILSISFFANEQGGVGKTASIALTLASMVAGFGWFGVLIWNRYYRN